MQILLVELCMQLNWEMPYDKDVVMDFNDFLSPVIDHLWELFVRPPALVVGVPREETKPASSLEGFFPSTSYTHHA